MEKILAALAVFMQWCGWGAVPVWTLFVCPVMYCLLGANGEDAKAPIRVAPFRVPDPVLMERHCKAEGDLVAFEARIGRRYRTRQVLGFMAIAMAFAVGYRVVRMDDDEGRMIRSFGIAPRQPLPSPSRSRPPHCQCRDATAILIEGRVLPVSLREPRPHLIIRRVRRVPYTFSFCR